MVRKLAIAAFAFSALSSGVAQALGLGEATVQSSLNQPLTAEIELINVRDLQNNEILTGLADREEFVEAGVDRVFFLSDLRFKVEVNDKGNTVIRVTSSKPVREPFLNFLVEVNWPSGRLLREYAILIDPPAFGQGSAAPVQIATTPAAATTAPTPSASTSTSPQRVAPSTPATVSSRQAASSSSEPPVQSQPDSQPSAPTSAQQSYGPTRANDTMWSIALKTRPDDGITPQQMMLAIQDLNPDAFINDNVNQLKKNQLLQLPSEEQISLRSSREASSAFAQQTQEFNASKSRPQSLAADTSSGQGQVARDELRVIVDEGSAEASINPASTGVSQDGSATGSGSNEELALVQEQLDLTNRENEDLKSRLEELQDQLATMQRLVALKDDQLAAVQAESGLEDRLVADATDANSDSATSIDGDNADTAGTTQEDAEAGAASDSEELVLADVTQDEAANGATTAAIDSASSTGSDGDSSDSSNDQSTQDPLAAQPTTTENNLAASNGAGNTAPASLSLVDQVIDNVKNNVVYQGALAAGGALLLLMLWMASRRKGATDEGAAELAGEQDLPEQGLGQQERVAAEEAPKAAGRALVDDEAADPIAEADVYVAYQKYDQASQVLEDAINEQPGNSNNYQLKLLEVLGESKKAGKFAAVLGVLEASADSSVVERAGEIKARYADLTGTPDISLDDLENQLMSGDHMALDEALADTELSDDFELDVDIENSSEVESAIAKSERDVEFLEKNDFDLKAEADVQPDDDLDIDFDLSDIDLDDTIVKEPVSDLDSTQIDFETSDSLNAEGTVTNDDTILAEKNNLASEGLDGALKSDLMPSDELSDNLEADLKALDELPEQSLFESSDLDSELASDSDLDSEFADLDDYEGLGDDGTQDTDDTDKAEESIDSASLELADDELDISLDSYDDLDSVSSSTDALELDQVNLDDTVNLEDTVSMLAEEAAAGAAEAPEGVVKDIADIDLNETLEESVANSLGGKVSNLDDNFDADMEEDFDFLSDTDEAATKLDLARAYVDMGDNEGARDILEEVVEEGSDEQKQEANDLLKGLS